ncbi:hypothetical protein HYH02_014878 [Chlamydomonas schloesseri]|uniref:Uncharacterized protein n=1 Tax=Chlamydomonas schloesseri TaxID=2026947 RepID=A0A835SI69_9CHLO|nr:hypothetical protein HYH02_014878 [Chlamydomonas schloesseri]|eukprot:KAG2426016.1 hypothetical protein HYH02_014878 [Chlamydomonas schloesseri]
MVTRCCTPPSGGGSSAAVGGSGGNTSSSSPVVTPSSDPDLDRLLYNIVAWTADAGGGGGGVVRPERDPATALLCVSDPRYLDMARFVSEQSSLRPADGRTGTGTGTGLSLSTPIRDITALRIALPLSRLVTAYQQQSQQPGNSSDSSGGDGIRRPDCDVYVIGAYDSAYSLPYVQQALVWFVRSGGGLVVPGPDVMPSAFYRRQRQQQKSLVPVPAQDQSGSRSSSCSAGRRRLRQDGLGGGGGGGGEGGQEEPELDATSIEVNAITGPLGLTFSGYVSDPGGNLTLASPSLYHNAELAAAAYVEYLQGQVALSPPDLKIALSTITRARATLPRSSSGSGIYGSGADAFWALSDAAAVLEAGGLLSPPSPPPSSPPPPPTALRWPPGPQPPPSPTPAPRNLSVRCRGMTVLVRSLVCAAQDLRAIAAGLLSMTAVGCVAEIPTARLLPYLVTANAPGRSNSMDRCVGAAAVPAADRFRTAGLVVSSPAGPQPPGAPSGPVIVLHVGVSGTQCWYGEVGTTSQPPPAPAASRQLDGARCSTVCPGAPSERCGGPPSTVNGTAAVLMSVVRIELQLPAAVPPEVVPPPPPTESKQQLPPSPQQQPQRPSPAPTTGGGGGASGGSSGRHPPPPSRDHGNGRGTGSSSGGRGSAAPPPRMVVKLRPGTVVRPVMQQHGGSRRAAAEQ